MKESEKTPHQLSGSLVAKNTFYNLLGYGIPLIFALVIIPFLIKGLGEERFGILSLAWVVIGYFSFFDFGIGKALTKIISEKIGSNKLEEIPKFFWTSILLMLFVSLVGASIVLLMAPTIVFKIFNISSYLQEETLSTFYVLAISIPIVTTSAGLRGLLEAYHRFGVINVIRTFLGVSSFLVPLICLYFTISLYWIVISLIIIRVIVWLLYIYQCFKLNSQLKIKLYFQKNLIKPILKLSSWMTVSNITVPLIVYIDRFLIGALLPAIAIAYYTTPYEVISKLLIIPSAVTGVLFPTFSASYATNPDFTKKISLKAIKYIFLFLYPIILVIIVFSNEGLTLWLGTEFAGKSTLILQLLAAGVLFNSLAYIPFSFLEGIGRPDITAKIQLSELPIYLIAMWIAIKYVGINGAALVWLSRMFIDAALLFFFANKKLGTQFENQINLSSIIILLLLFASFSIVLVGDTILKLGMVMLILLLFTLLLWKYLLAEDEKTFLLSRLQKIKS